MHSSSCGDDDLDAVVALASSPSDPLGQRIKAALDIIIDALATYGEEHAAISFNGGKDCTVLLHLFATALHLRRQHVYDRTRLPTPSPIPALYIYPPSSFPALEDFIHASEQRYSLALFRVAGVGGMKSALEVYKHARPDVTAILVGTRRNDPHGAKLSVTTPTDKDWPEYQRVHPVLDWSHADIWAFLRRLHVPYCPLYDAGYTSLGSTYNTLPNPALREKGLGDDEKYRPAYELEDETLERAGRIRGPAPPLPGRTEESAVEVSPAT